jgi:hypothetical protein
MGRGDGADSHQVNSLPACGQQCCSWQKDCAPLAVVTGRHMLARSAQLTSQGHPAQAA